MYNADEAAQQAIDDPDFKAKLAELQGGSGDNSNPNALSTFKRVFGEDMPLPLKLNPGDN